MSLLAIHLFFAICAAALAEPEPSLAADDDSSNHEYNWYTELELEEQVNETTVKATDRSDIRCFLWTRNNPIKPDILVLNNYTSLQMSKFKENQPTNIIIAGWLDILISSPIIQLVAAFLSSRDTANSNVLVVDWHRVSKKPYRQATKGVPAVGKQLGEFLLWMQNVTTFNLNTVHMVGYDMGAHVAGVAGRELNGSIARITALDPAGPLWHNNPDALNTDSAQYVELICTDGKRFSTLEPIGHANFYPNGGTQMPGCVTHLCAHHLSFKYMAATLRYNHMVAQQCHNVSEAQKNQCSGVTFMMGNGHFPKKGFGIYGLKTQEKYPYYPLLPAADEAV